MDEERVQRLAAKKFAIGFNTGRKQERERRAGESRKSYKAGIEAGQEKERDRQAKKRAAELEARGRKKQYQRWIIITVSLTVIVLKAIEVLILQILSGRPLYL